MSYTLSTQLIGGEELQKALSDTETFAQQVIADALNKTANELQKMAHDGAPHKSGKLQASIHTQYASPGNLEAKVGTNVVYARAQEYGTQGMTINVSQGRRTRGGGHTGPYSYAGNIPPKFYMKTAMENIRPQFTNYLQQAAQKIVEHIAGK